jgi:hypothetical protein
LKYYFLFCIFNLSRSKFLSLKYVTTLGKLITEAKKSGKAKGEGAEDESFLKKIEHSVVPKWTANTDGEMNWPVDGIEEVDADKARAIGTFNLVRWSVADHVTKL